MYFCPTLLYPVSIVFPSNNTLSPIELTPVMKIYEEETNKLMTLDIQKNID